MTCLLVLNLAAIVILWGACDAQCIVRTMVPMTYMEQCTPFCGCMPSTSSSTDDLSALLLLARALNNNEKPEKPAQTCNSGHNINVEDIITKLINALVYTTTQTVGKHNQPVANTGCQQDTSSPPHQHKPGGNSGHYYPSPGGSTKDDDSHQHKSGGNSGHYPHQSGSKKDDDSLIGLDLLKDNKVLDLDLGKTDVLDLELGGSSDSSSKGNDGGAVGGLLNGLL